MVNIRTVTNSTAKQSRIKKSTSNILVPPPKEKTLCKLFYRRVLFLQAYNQLCNDILVIHIANEQFNNRYYTLELMRMGLIPGVADYLILYPGGKAAFIEFKRDGKSKQSDNQKKFEAKVTSIGFPYLLTWDVDEAIEWIKSLYGRI